MTTQRAFNKIAIGAKTVTKSSGKIDKMRAEANWFQTLPDDLKVHTPRMIREIAESDRHGYEIEYLYLTALNELFVFGSLPRFVWRRIFTTCFGFLDQCRRHPGDGGRAGAAGLFREKTAARLAVFAAAHDADLQAAWTINGRATPGLESIAELTARTIEAIAPQPDCVSHGDFCFSNILFDFRSQGIKLIDPRGLDARGRPAVHGPQLYDLAKLAHSAVGLYDFIIAGAYTLSRSGRDIELAIHDPDANKDIQALFLEMVGDRFGLTATQLGAMQVHLFLSMLPLHDDDPERQSALLGNALRIFAQIEDTL